MSETEEVIVPPCAGGVIKSAKFVYNGEDAAHFELRFQNGEVWQLGDVGQECCERRYMTTDDDLASLRGSKLIKIVVKPSQEVEGEEVHETCFVEVVASGGSVTLVNHNEHNGYYGGFSVRFTKKRNT